MIGGSPLDALLGRCLVALPSLIFLTSITVCAQETVILNNGTRLDAHLQSVLCDSRNIVLDLNGLGTASIRWDAITSISSDMLTKTGTLNLSLENTKVLVTVGSGERVASPKLITDGPTIVNLLSRRCGIQEQATPEYKGSDNVSTKNLGQTAAAQNSDSFWTGKLESSSALSIGTQTQETLSGRLVLAYNRNPTLDSWSKHTTTQLDIEAAYGNSAKKGAARTMNNQLWYGSLLHGFIKSQTTLYPFGILYHNFSQGMRLEQSYGFGAKYSFRKTEQHDDETMGQQLRRNVILAADVRAIHEDFGKLAAAFSSPGAGISFDDSFHIGPIAKLKFIWQEHIEIIPAFRSAKAFQARATSALIVPVTKRFNLNMQFTDFYIRNAPPDHRQNYSKTTISFGYLLGRLPK